MIVSQLPKSEQVRQALAEITAFEQSKVPGVWRGLDKKQLIAQLRSRVNNPLTLNQGSQPFCGPAVIIFELIRRDPLYYVKICRNLFQIGGFHTRSERWISASEKLRNAEGNYQMPQVDWMILSTLRESENLLVPVQPNSPDIIRNLGGMTKPWEICEWVKEILGYQKHQYKNTYLFGDLKAMLEVSEVLNSGGVALALINDGGLLRNQPPRIPYPSHWVSIFSDISILSTKSVKFEVYTWAKRMQVQVDEVAFKTHFWGVVMGQDK
ncbi:hypothetical protein VB834_05120 [Limnoraphis robusta Tam1]|uniref:Uncharacterized protein n=1 Tax=Limnoraphis robusta CCNP1315 TaxID=3110306 RepID=A0ABU5U8E3_9CYAN|nr:hypothetical protein [Limnoraphis robusta]MEA5498051.1 hypothetical protein [Limnoraphis robusta BA-68 BA1]MEA5523315.1 hypothetical protein [Limnoraphis robusta CCNP1315]MEA5538410.1 hypothetical protein [Limnoraphis robusta Tam1]MEA5547599.1 hypothetical protein [Limnoraphis robusta CCNP1324]